MFCLNYLQCYLLTFDLSSHRCEIFSNISIEYGNLIQQQDVITMITLDNEQLFNSMSHKIAEASNIKSIMANRITPTIANTGGTITTARETTTSSSTTATTITSKINTAIHVSSSIKSNDATIAITTTNETNTSSNKTTNKTTTTTTSTTTRSTISITTTTINSCATTSATSTTSSSTSSCTTASEATTSSASSTTKNPCTSGNLLWNKTGITILSSSSPIITSGVFIDLNDKLYAADENANYIVSKLLRKVPGTMVVAETFGSPKLNSSQLNFVNDVYVDIYGNIYVTDTRNYRIQKYINGSKNATSLAGVNGSAGSALNQLNTSRYFTFDSTDTYMYIVDSGNHRILRYLTNSTSGTNGTLVAGGTGTSNANTSLNSPWGIHYLPSISNDLFITNTNGHSVIRWTPGASSGVFVAGKPGVSGSNSTLLNYPTGIKLDNYMNIYVADTQNNRIQLFCANSNIGATIAGNGSAGSDAIQLDGPRGIAFDSAMNMYIGDVGNLRVQKFMKL
ncbi:unnamed protein product [Adineta steineri]|uniref:NHL repeat containing protein n=1 Tax=Adineta steineri TaxID=433720 RepID=A0A814R4B5_9BILA|nr:unnamed protein product [Adineta steineri]CAF1443376.1 unnamed protein product [Adineta steineri]